MDPRLLPPGVLPSQLINAAIGDGWITAGDSQVPPRNVQPASLDLRLGSVAYRLRCSFLPDNEPVEQALRRYTTERVSLRQQGIILEQNRPYLIPLVEQLSLPEGVRAKASPKSSTGRLDIFTRVISDNNFMFDEIPDGYHGRLYLEVVSRTFPVRVLPGISLNQLRLMTGRSSLTDEEIAALHASTPLLFRDSRPRPPDQIAVSNGLFMALDLGRPGGHELVGYSAKEDSTVLDLSKVNHYQPRSFWDEVLSEPGEHGARIILRPEKFYLLLSLDRLRIPPGYAAEMTAYDPTSGELRTHYAGFFDPGFGYDGDPAGRQGSRVALEVRAHDVPFAVEHGQNICKFSFEKMAQCPDRLYGAALDSNYQGQEVALSKHFKRDRPGHGGRHDGQGGYAQPGLFPLTVTR
ncbi:MAG TPA: 2'-deoxycytidine 5'-triphosphate deaminase [Streptosporangiaceae bacterium]